MTIKKNKIAECRMRKAFEGIYRKAPAGIMSIPYFNHLAIVAGLLKEANLSDDVVAAGYLHDAIEDLGWTTDDISKEFGPYVARLVYGVSEIPKGYSWEARKEAYVNRINSCECSDVVNISCADKISNLFDMNMLMEKGYEPGTYMKRGLVNQVWFMTELHKAFKEKADPVLFGLFDDELNKLISMGEEMLKKA